MNFVRALCGCACSGLGLLLLAGASPLPDGGATGEATAPLAATTPAEHPDAAAPQRPVPPSPIPPAVSTDTAVDTCPADQACVDRYLWSLYTRTPKLDTVSISERKSVKVTHKGKTRTVTKTETRVVGEDFAWKDPKAAELAGKSLMDYVIGGMDPGFRGTLYHALRALDDAGFQPGIMCAFRDDYRQSIATGLKAQNDRSFHGGSFRGGYGHGVAADIVSVRGENRTDKLAASAQMWDFIDTHEGELGIGRPYRDRDPPHVGAVDGEEYAGHRLKKNPALQARNGKNPGGHDAKAAAKNGTKNGTKTGAKTGAKAGAKTGTKNGTKSGTKTGTKTGSKTADKPAVKAGARPGIPAAGAPARILGEPRRESRTRPPFAMM